MPKEAKKTMNNFIKDYSCELLNGIGFSILVALSSLNLINYSTLIILNGILCVVSYLICLKRLNERVYPISKKTFLFLIIGEFLMTVWMIV